MNYEKRGIKMNHINIRKVSLLFVTAFVWLAIVNSTFGQDSAPIPKTLRGDIAVDQVTIDIALKMQKQGWEYVMPAPKSNKARWGNSDGRTTWWEGYWHNINQGKFSSTTPVLKNGTYVGDGIDGRGWRRGGSPWGTTDLQWLLSSGGGIKPR